MPSKRSAPKGKSSKNKKSKTNSRKRAAPVYWGKPASIYVGGQSLALESAKLPESAKGVAVQDFDGTWKLDTDKSETLEAYLKTMGVTEIACEAAMKAEKQYATYHVITIENEKYTVSRKSRMANRTSTYSFGNEQVETRKSGREFKILVRKTDTPRIVEETCIDNKQKFTLTRTLVMKDRMHCRQVLKIPSKAVVTQRYFDRTSIPKDFEIDEDFMKNKPEIPNKKNILGTTNNSASKNVLLNKSQGANKSAVLNTANKMSASSNIIRSSINNTVIKTNVSTTKPVTTFASSTSVTSSTSSIDSSGSTVSITSSTAGSTAAVARTATGAPTSLGTTKLGLHSSANVDAPIFISNK
jgi:hypothetical protein